MSVRDRVPQLVRSHGHTAAVAILLAVHALLLARIAVVNSPTLDEIAHLPAGLSHWKFGNFDLYRVNPPLVRMIAAAPLLFADPKTDWGLFSEGPQSRAEFSVGRRFLAVNGPGVFRLFTMARWALIPVSLLGGWICYCWARELFGKASGLVALILWCFCPNVLAWGATITPDLGAAAFGVAAAYAFWRWLRSPTWTRALLAGVTLGLAELTKSTWIVLFPLWPLLWIGWNFAVRRAGQHAAPARQLAVVLLLALYVLNLGYAFERTFQPLGEFTFISRALSGEAESGTPGNRLRDHWLGKLPAPVPANYLLGIDVQKHDFEEGKWSYLRGQHRRGGWYYYYVYALAVKTPLGTIFLFLLSLAVIASRPAYRLPFMAEMVLWVPALAVLVLVSSQTGFNRYLRYVLPAVPFLLIAASRVAKAFEMKQRALQVFCTAAVLAGVLDSLWVYPHSMSYFNLAAGGPIGGPKHLLDANIDWGQDLLELKRFINRHPEASPIGLAYFGFTDPALTGIAFNKVPPAPGVEHRDGEREGDVGPQPGWFAVSVNYVYGYRHYESDGPAYAYFQRFKPVAMAGYSIYIYHITPDEANRVRRELGLPKTSQNHGDSG